MGNLTAHDEMPERRGGKEDGKEAEFDRNPEGIHPI